MDVDTDRLSAALDHALVTVDELRGLIERERRCLEERAAEDLEAVSAAKESALMRLQEANPLAGRGLTAPALEDWLRQHGDESLLAQWRRFLDGLRSVRRDNERNGIAIRRSLETIVGELRLLRGGQSPLEPATYGSDGVHRGGESPGIAAKA